METKACGYGKAGHGLMKKSFLIVSLSVHVSGSIPISPVIKVNFHSVLLCFPELKMVYE